jgi:hypothetical protein
MLITSKFNGMCSLNTQVYFLNHKNEQKRNISQPAQRRGESSVLTSSSHTGVKHSAQVIDPKISNVTVDIRKGQMLNSAPKTYVVHSSETLLPTYKSTRRYIPEDQHRDLRSRNNLKSYTNLFWCCFISV